MSPLSLLLVPAFAVLVAGDHLATSTRTGVAGVEPSGTAAPSRDAHPRQAPQVGAQLAAQLRAALTEWAGDPRHFGVTAAVRFPDGRAWRDAAGSAGADGPMRPDHMVQVASIGKTMTAALILRLVDAGRLRLADTLGALLPPIRHVSPAITLRQLLNHTAGLSAYGTPEFGRAIAAWGDTFFRGTQFSPATRKELRTIVPAAGNIPGETGTGLGVRAYSYLGRQQFGHSGGSVLGSSLMLHDPATAITVAVLMNQGANADHFALAPRLLAIASGAARATP